MKWTILESIIRSSPKQNLARIKTLIMEGDVYLEVNLYPVLPIFTGLNSLQLKRMTSIYVQIDTILRLCPGITELYMDSIDSNEHGARKLYLEHKKTPLPILKLRSLTLIGWTIMANTLLQVLGRCPNINELKLIQLHLPDITGSHSTPENTNIFNKIASNCSQLKSLQFSCSNLPSLNGEESFSRIMDAFPRLESWGTRIQDIQPWMFHHLGNCMVQTLTTLEIVGSSDSGIIIHGEGLHKFLCSAVNLLHLRADNVCFVEDHIFVLEDSLPNSRVNSGLHSKRAKRIWACRNLRTLRIGFQRTINLLSLMTLKSRSLFAYIVNVCPRLAEIHILHYALDFSLKGGFCLLSELKELERLEIYSSNLSEITLPLADIEWIRSDGGAIPWEQLTGVQKIKWWMASNQLKESADSRADTRRFKGTSGKVSKGSKCWLALGNDERLTYQIQKASCLDNVANVLDDLRRRQDRCWPLLEKLKIDRFGYGKPKMESVSELIRQIRPEIDNKSRPLE
ncbi:hypothetical protein BGZ76_011839 [Entomortierella beljakovae]|nr:hypothetical protein BGZ76_011839 [Entomortierella beljakovae]